MKGSIAQHHEKRWAGSIKGVKAHKKILVDSVCCEPWGFDAMRYTFKDGSMLIYDKITRDWVL